MISVKIPRIIFKVLLDFEFINFTSFCLKPTELNDIINFAKEKASSDFSQWKNKVEPYMASTW
jgi:hypothetical protein